MGIKSTVRRRRSPQEARAEILDAAEAILLGSGPADLKFQRIAAEAGISQSNIHHHFGGVLEIKKALVDRMFAFLAQELAGALTISLETDRETRITKALRDIYSILSQRRYARLISWMSLSSHVDQMVYVSEPIKVMQKLVVTELENVMDTDRAEKHAKAIVFQVAATAVGDGLIREYLVPSLDGDASDLDAARIIIDMVLEE